jgi:hypothetical protein
MKTIKFIGLIAIATATFSSAQGGANSAMPLKRSLAESDEVIHSLLVLDKNVIENAKVLIHDLRTKQALYNESALYHTNEIGRSLNTSEDYLSRLGKATDVAIDEIGIGYLAGLHKHYVKAIDEQRALKDELAKGVPEKSVLLMKATVIYAEMKKAESEQLEMDRSAGIKEPETPAGQ